LHFAIILLIAMHGVTFFRFILHNATAVPLSFLFLAHTLFFLGVSRNSRPLFRISLRLGKKSFIISFSFWPLSLNQSYLQKDFRLAVKRRLNTQHKSDLDALPDATARKAALAELWNEYEATLKAALVTANKHLMC